MLKLLWLAVLAACVWRLALGRWPWQPSPRAVRRREQAAARILLRVSETADRRQVLEAHRRYIASVHPDRGGTNEQVHEGNAARDTLLATLPGGD